MTTIATDGVTIAGDGLRVWGSDVIETNCKKIRVAHGRIYAFAGTWPLFGAVVDWHNAGADPKAAPETKDGWTLLVLTPLGVMKFSESCPYPDPIPVPLAIGSGCDQAMGAMMVGATPEEAVRAVCAVAINSGGEVQVVNIASALGTPMKAHRMFEPIQIEARRHAAE